MAEGKGTQAKPEQNDRGGKKAAIIQAAELQLDHNTPLSCFKPRSSWGRDGRGAHSNLSLGSLPPLSPSTPWSQWALSA